MPSRLDKDGPSAMGSYTHTYRWIANNVLGNSRTEAHVQHLLKHVTVVHGRLIQRPVVK